jgi:hypothetical protein
MPGSKPFAGNRSDSGEHHRIRLYRSPTTGQCMMQDKTRGWLRLWSVARLMVLLCLTAMWEAVAWSAHVPHLQWMAPYRAADGSACCDITDCFKAAVTLLSEPTEEMVRVLVSTVEDTQHQQVGVQTVVVVPGRSIHRSEDAQSWYCTRAHFQSWNALGETTSQPCATAAGYRIISPCVRCIFVNVGA